MDPPKKVLIGDFSKSLYFVKKEFDGEGPAHSAELDLQVTVSGIVAVDINGKIICDITFTDGSTEQVQGPISVGAIISQRITFPGEKTIASIRLRSEGTDPIIDYGILGTGCGESGINKKLNLGYSQKITLNQSALNLQSGMQCVNEGLFSFAASVENVRLAGLGLNYFGARYYDPEVGIWTATDPRSQFWNSYSYVDGNPVVMVDPNGEIAEWIIATAFYAFVGIGGAIKAYQKENNVWKAINPFGKEHWDGVGEWVDQFTQGHGTGTAGWDSNKGVYSGIGNERHYSKDNDAAEAASQGMNDFYAKANTPLPNVDLAMQAAQVLASLYTAPSGGLKFGNLGFQTATETSIDDRIWGRLETYEILVQNGYCEGSCRFGAQYSISGSTELTDVRQMLNKAWEGTSRNLSRTPAGDGLNLVWWPGLNFPSAIEESHIGVYYQGTVYDYSEGEGRRQTPFEEINSWARVKYRGALFMPVQLR